MRSFVSGIDCRQRIVSAILEQRMARPPREVLFSFGQGWCSADASAMDCCILVPAIRRSYLCPCRGGIPSYTRNGLPSNRITGPISNILCASDRYLRFAGTAQRPARLDVRCCSPDAMAMGCWIPVPAIRRYRRRTDAGRRRSTSRADGVWTRRAIWHWRWSRAAASSRASGCSSGRASRVRRP